MNYRALDERLATGGHFVGDGLEQLAAQGLEVVIDLRGETPREQVEALARHGIRLVSVPVSWQSPQPEEYRQFAAAMDAHRGRKLLVQCAANYRASAMTYLYRVAAAGVPEPQARQDMEAIWQPNATWRRYLSEVAAAEATTTSLDKD